MRMTQDIATSLHQLVRHCSKDRFQRLQTANCFVGDQIRHIEDEYPAYASIMVMGANAFRVQFTFFYHATDLFELASKNTGIPILDFSREQLQDYIEEFCNVVAGAINANLQEHNIRSRIGLPMSSKGFGAPGVKHLTYVDYFELSSSETTMLGKTVVHIFPDEPMPNYSFSEFSMTEQEIDDFFDFA